MAETMNFTKFERALLEKKVVDEEQLTEAKKKSMGSKRTVQVELIEIGAVSEDNLFHIMSEMYPHVEKIDLYPGDCSPDLAQRIPYDLTQKYDVAPVKLENGALTLAMTNPGDLMAVDDIETLTRAIVKPVLVRRSQITDALKSLYELDESIYDLYKNLGIDDNIEIVKERDEEEQRSINIRELNNDAKMAPVIKLVNLLIGDAIRMRASDIHLEPRQNDVELRYRIDGVLQSVMTFPKHLHAPTVSRIKIMSDLDIAERRKPQDGGARIKFDNRQIDLRISIIPTFSGEKVVIRILDATRGRIALENVGFTDQDLSTYELFLQKHQGMILVTGPTGSGKTTTLYGSLSYLNDGSKNITSIENPVEYQVEGINQIQINPLAGVTFASSLRSILRQDPNVIFVGEIRDFETAEISFQAAQTGHLVLSTVHTMSTVSTITRLIDIGIEKYLISSSLIGVIAQRLIRVICPKCKTEVEPPEEIINEIGLQVPQGVKFYKGAGCEHCNYTGFYGRTAFFEILRIDDELKELIAKDASEPEMMRAAQKNGMKILSETALQKVYDGITTLEEAVEVANIRKSYTSEPPQPQRKKNDLTTILVIDDDPYIRKMVKASLSKEPVRIVEAENGQEGIEKAHQESPDLIIMDIMMPVMDGMTACKKLKSNLQTGHIPLMMFTARGSEESEIEGLEAGADDYITKPVTPKKLLTRVNKLLGKIQAHASV